LVEGPGEDPVVTVEAVDLDLIAEAATNDAEGDAI